MTSEIKAEFEVGARGAGGRGAINMTHEVHSFDALRAVAPRKVGFSLEIKGAISFALTICMTCLMLLFLK